jgi:predicted TIM-barrel fold metal-dependent hydrolase
MRIDCQSHVFPQSYIEILAQNPHPPQVVPRGDESLITYGDVQQFRLRAEKYDPKTKLEDMNRAGIDISVISTNIPGPCMLAPELALKGAQALNNFIADVIARYPGRFAGLASLPWQNPDDAITEMDRAKEELDFRGVMLYSHIGGRPVDHPEFAPVYAHAEAKRLPIVLHPTVPTWGEAIKDHWMIPMMGLQVDTSFALLRLILSGILERHPRLQVVMPHVGGVLPYMIGRIDHQTEVMGRGRENITQPPSEYLRRIYLDLVSPSEQALQYAYQFSGPDRLVFGTDHPWVEPQIFINLIEGMDISAQAKAKIFGTNAKTLFKLD